MEIIVAEERHAEQIARLWRDANRETAALQPEFYRETGENVESALSVIREDDRDFLIAVENGDVLGFAFLLAAESANFPSLVRYGYAHLIELYVRPGEQGKGVGTALLNAVKRWALERKLPYVELQVLHGNPRAKALYEREAFFDVLHTMYCRVDG